MSEPAILFAKPGAVRPSDKGVLRKAGIIVVEVEDLDDVRLVRPNREDQELPAGDLLAAFGQAVSETRDGDFSSTLKIAFARAVSVALVKRHAKPR